MPTNSTAISKVLVVDWDHSVLDFVVEELEESGYEVSDTDSVQDALELIGENNYDIIITELLMPKTDGFTFIKQLNMMEQSFRIIAMTEGNPTHSIENCNFMTERLGVQYFLKKPFMNEELLDLIDEASGHLSNVYFKGEEDEGEIFDDSLEDPLIQPHLKEQLSSNDFEDEEDAIPSEHKVIVRDYNPDESIDEYFDSDTLVITYRQLLHIVKAYNAETISERELWMLEHIKESDRVTQDHLTNAWNECRHEELERKRAENQSNIESGWDEKEWNTKDDFQFFIRTYITPYRTLILVLIVALILSTAVIITVNKTDLLSGISNNEKKQKEKTNLVSDRELNQIGNSYQNYFPGNDSKNTKKE